MNKLSFPPIADIKSKVLLLGTMPGEQSLKLQQYYGHKGNHFWKLIFALFDHPVTDNYASKRQLLLDKGIAVWDVLQSCEREGSADIRINKEIANDFASFYRDYPTISSVFFTSKKAETYYYEYVGRNEKVRFYNLPSPSSANTWKTFAEKLNEWKLILKFL